MSEFDENKFIVINRKRFNELESEEGIITGLALIDCISKEFFVDNGVEG